MSPLVLLDALTKLLNEHGSSEILRERLALLRDQTQALEKENVELKKSVTDLEDRNRNLAAQLKAQARSEEFVERRGVLFKRNPAGGYHEAVYCPICYSTLGTIHPELPYACRKSCGFIFDINRAEMLRILADLS